jgi:hypothetical protein
MRAAWWLTPPRTIVSFTCAAYFSPKRPFSCAALSWPRHCFIPRWSRPTARATGDALQRWAPGLRLFSATSERSELHRSSTLRQWRLPSLQASIPCGVGCLAHQIFAALTQGIIFELQELEAAIRALGHDRARDALGLAGDLLMASAAAFRFTADFFPSAYTDVVRPRMMAQHVGEGFSGVLSADHRRLVAVLVRTRPLMGEIATRFATEHKRLTVALDQVYDAHKYVCARFVGEKKPSLRCPNSSPMAGVAQLDQYHRGRAGLLRSDSSDRYGDDRYGDARVMPLGRELQSPPVLNERPLL